MSSQALPSDSTAEQPFREFEGIERTALGDFTTDRRVILISLIAIVLGVLSTFLAFILLNLISFFTNLAFFQRLSTAPASPADNTLGFFVVLVPVVGALIIGLMARFGSERIRGHGIPEAIESILLNGSKVQPRLVFLKPVSAAISIGTGGPFGAEGPIIMTGGAFGSMIAQFIHLTSAERKTLLVAGAAGGMSATFASPIGAVLLAVELLLFEWKPRSLIPVALASATAAASRRYVLGPGPVFPVPPHPTFIGPAGLLSCVLVGLLAGVLALALTRSIYMAEDAFHHLPIHWMWWPAIGGLVVGLGGLIFPQALGVGYDVIGDLLQGNVTGHVILGVLLVKATIWAVSLGSGTSGGVLAPLLMVGGALGGLEAMFLPNEGPGFWPLVSMGAVLGGTMRAPLTGIVFSYELTQDGSILLPLLIATVLSYGLTVLVSRRSILTEKISRRGFHLSSEYSIDPLEVLFVREAMRTSVTALPSGMALSDLADSVNFTDGPRMQRLFPVVDPQNHLVGVITRQELQRTVRNLVDDTGRAPLDSVMSMKPVVAYPDEPLRVVVYRMAETGLTQFPVVSDDTCRELMGTISLSDLLKARVRNLEEERHRERIFRVRKLDPRRQRVGSS